MEIVDVIALAHFEDSRVGGVTRKQRLRLAAPLAAQLAELGLVRPVTPFAPGPAPLQSPTPDAGPAPLLSLSPLVHHLMMPTAEGSPLPSESEAGAQSPSTTPTASSPAPTHSTPATSGGGSTSAPAPKHSKASGGPKTAKPRSGSR